MNQYVKIGVRSFLCAGTAAFATLSTLITQDPTGASIPWLAVGVSAGGTLFATAWSGFKSLDDTPDGKMTVSEHQVVAYVPSNERMDPATCETSS